MPFRIEQVIGRAVRRWREFKGLTQTQLGQALAAQTGVPWSRQAVSAAEAGNRAFSASDLLALALTLGIEFGQLLSPEDLDEDEFVELPSGEQLPARTLVDLYYGKHGRGLRGSAPVLRSLLNARSSVYALLESVDGTIGLITEDSIVDIQEPTNATEGQALPDGEGADSEGEA